jgi:hypothetical protein
MSPECIELEEMPRGLVDITTSHASTSNAADDRGFYWSARTTQPQQRVVKGPSRLIGVAAKLNAFLALPPGWNSYDASPIREESVETAWALLSCVLGPQMPLPYVVPLPSGGVQLEWHTERLDLEIEIESPDRMAVYYQLGDEEHECEVTVDLTPIVEAMELLRRNGDGTSWWPTPRT